MKIANTSIALLLLCSAINANSQQAASVKHRALLIGINTYRPDGAEVSSDPKAWHPEIPNLDGCENDADEMKKILLNTYGWSESDIQTLKGRNSPDKSAQPATRANIIAALDKIAAEATDGEAILVYFSGHGSSVTNSKSHKFTAPGKDGNPVWASNTFVPADSIDGIPDITDKEFATEFNKILAAPHEHVVLTAVFDSCFSGEMARGTSDLGHTKSAESAILEVPDEDVKDPGPATLPYQHGALILSAARYFEPAEEYPKGNQPGTPRGAFSLAFTQSIMASPGASVRQLFAAARSKLKAMNFNQEPAFEAQDYRLNAGLFGENVKPVVGLRCYVSHLPDDKNPYVVISRGAEQGIHPRAILQGEYNGQKVTAVVKSANFGESNIALQDGGRDAFLKVPYFEVTSFASADYPGLTVCVPRSSETMATLLNEGTKLASGLRGVVVESDPTTTAPTANAFYENAAWHIASPGRDPTTIGSSLTTAALEKTVHKGDRLFTSYPVSAELAQTIAFGKTDDDMVREVDGLDKAPNYVLTGSIIDGKLAYAWIASGAGTVSGAVLEKAKREAPEEQSLADAADCMPKKTNWIFASDSDLAKTAERLKNEAEKLAILRNWFLLSSHDDGKFPVHLEIVDTQTNKVLNDGDTVLGYLPKPPADAAPNDPKYREPQTTDRRYQFQITLNNEDDVAEGMTVESRFTYLLNIDPDYAGGLVYPAMDEEELAWHPTLKRQKLALGNPSRFTGSLGTENFILITSKTPISDLEDVFIFKGLDSGDVRSRSAGPGDPLTQLLRRAHSGTRAARGDDDVPVTWSVQRFTLKSVPYDSPEGKAASGGQK